MGTKGDLARCVAELERLRRTKPLLALIQQRHQTQGGATYRCGKLHQFIAFKLWLGVQ